MLRPSRSRWSLRPLAAGGRSSFSRLSQLRPTGLAVAVVAVVAVVVLGEGVSVALVGAPVGRAVTPLSPGLAPGREAALHDAPRFAGPLAAGRSSWGSGAAASASPSAAPSADAHAPVPPVAPLAALVAPDLLVTGGRAVPMSVVRGAPGVRTALAVDVGSVAVKGSAARGLAADPSRLRAWTPRVTAASDPLWRSVAAGDVATTFDLGKEKDLGLGSTVSLTRHGGAQVPVRLGALVSTGLPGIDLVASAATGRALGFSRNAGALVSAPGVDVQALRDRLQARLGSGFEVALVNEPSVQLSNDPGAPLTRAQLFTAIRAAEQQLGKPYVWGATGPDGFDCSGLVGWAFHAAGVQLPRTSEQLWFAGQHVAPEQARAGDLLFWAEDPSAPFDMDHVAIYLGAGMMVVAPHTGDVVKVTRVYGHNFRGVVRLDPTMAARVGGAQWSTTGPGSTPSPP